jgi:predicted dehydrogenase
MSIVRTGVVGVGHLGYHHARLYRAMEGVELVGVCDTNPGRCAEVASEFGVPGCATTADLVARGVQAVSVAVPTVHHRAVASELLEAGVDVLVEKPIASTVADAEAMVALALERDRLLQVGHVERFNGAVIALAERFRNPRFIECHRMSPYPNRGDDVSVVLDLMIHDIDVVLSLVNSPVKSLDAIGVAVFSPQEDIANVRLRFENNCVANLTASRISLERMRKIRIFETDAYVSTDYSEQEVLVYRRKSSEDGAVQSPMELIRIESLPVKREEPLALELAAFVSSVRNRTRPVVSGEDGLRALRLAFDIMQFIRENT